MARISSPVLLHPMSVVGICRTILLVYLRKLPKLFLWALLFLIVPVLGTVYLIDFLAADIGDLGRFAVLGLFGSLLLLGWAVAIVWFYAVAAIVMSLAVENWHASTWQILRRLSGRISLHLLLTAASSVVLLVGYLAMVRFVGPASPSHSTVGALLISFLDITASLVLFRLIVSWCLTPAIVVLEGLSFYRAMRRSSRLLGGQFWRTVAAMLLCNSVLGLLLLLLVKLESFQHAVSYYILFGMHDRAIRRRGHLPAHFSLF